jgi:hypothetical protein
VEMMKKYLLCLSLLVSCVLAFAGPEKSRRVLFLLDGSSSMSLPYEKGQTRFQKAAATILMIMDSISAKEKNVEFALRVYGHQYPAQEKNCFDSKMEVPFSKANRAQMELRLDNLKPAGISPLAFSLSQISERDLMREFEYSIIIISDGGESCEDDYCSEAAKIKLKTKYIPVFIDLNTVSVPQTNKGCVDHKNVTCLEISDLFYLEPTANVDQKSIATESSPYISDTTTGFIVFRNQYNVAKVVLYQKMNGIKSRFQEISATALKSAMPIKVKTGEYKLEYMTHDNHIKNHVTTIVIRSMITSISLP